MGKVPDPQRSTSKPRVTQQLNTNQGKIKFCTVSRHNHSHEDAVTLPDSCTISTQAPPQQPRCSTRTGRPQPRPDKRCIPQEIFREGQPTYSNTSHCAGMLAVAPLTQTSSRVLLQAKKHFKALSPRFAGYTNASLTAGPQNLTPFPRSPRGGHKTPQGEAASGLGARRGS